MLERLAFKECLKKCLQEQGHKYNYDHRAHYKNYCIICKQFGNEIPMEAYTAQYYVSKKKPATVELAPLPKAVPSSGFKAGSICGKVADLCVIDDVIKNEGNQPMRYNDNYASASVTAPKSDLATSRDYFLKRTQETLYPKREEFEKLFNIHVDNSPRNYKQLIDAIKGGKYTLDDKVVKKLDAAEASGDELYYGMTYGIIWDGPKADYDGYEAALTENLKQQEKARDAIMAAATAGDMKAALEAFEAWTPTSAVGTAS